jgi:hypothetical protein
MWLVPLFALLVLHAVPSRRPRGRQLAGGARLADEATSFLALSATGRDALLETVSP